MDIDVTQLLSGGQLIVALYLAIQIRAILADHERRITSLERKHPPRKGRK